MKTILFVCTGNTCRSSMAEALFVSILEERGLESEYKIISAGTGAYFGDRASANAIKAMEEMSIDLNSHQATPLSIDLIQEADLILTMTQGHKSVILSLAPESKEKVFTLKEFCYRDAAENICRYDITDPFGQDIEKYRSCRDEIDTALRKAVERFREVKWKIED